MQKELISHAPKSLHNMDQSMVSGKNQGIYFKSAFLIHGHTDIDGSACKYQPAFK